jgi:hypothetical protein
MNLDADSGFPPWIVGGGLLICSLLCAILAARRPREPGTATLYWIGLAAVLLFLGLDEPFNLHRPFRLLRRVFDPGGSSTANFLLAALTGGAAFALIFARFLLRQPARFRNAMVAGAALYFCGLAGGKILKVFGKALGITMDPQRIEPVRLLLKLAGIACCLFALIALARHKPEHPLHSPAGEEP